MASDGCFLYAFIDGAGQWAEGTYVSGITPDPKAVTDESWWQAYQDLEARNPGTYSIAGHSALMVMAEGAERAKSLDAASISKTLKEVPLSTLIGTVDYDLYGDLTEQRIHIFQIQDGGLRPDPSPALAFSKRG
ncbi:MAG: ABC transporter substrate-binding protein [Anaerolineales bacterium]